MEGNITQFENGEAVVLQKDIKGFLREYKELCKKHGMSIIRILGGTIAVSSYQEKDFDSIDNGLYSISRKGFPVNPPVEKKILLKDEFDDFPDHIPEVECNYCHTKHLITDMFIRVIYVNTTTLDSDSKDSIGETGWFCNGTDCAEQYQTMMEKPYWKR